MVALPKVEGLRGDYGRAASDYTVHQEMGDYSGMDQAVWTLLLRRQRANVERYASHEFRRCLALLDLNDDIPRFAAANAIVRPRTGWRIVAVPGLIPDAVFFGHLAKRQFPVTVWMREPAELDYLVEPDLFHDFFGHVPLLLHPPFADYLQHYGELGASLHDEHSLACLARLYWYTVEFGLILEDNRLAVYGAGILSSRAETLYAVEHPAPNRVRFDMARVLRTQYAIDSFQKTYFVIRRFDELYRSLSQLTADRLAAVLALPSIEASEILPSDEPVLLHPAEAL